MNTKPKLKTLRVELRLSPNQKEELIRQANALNITMSELIINKLLLPEASL